MTGSTRRSGKVGAIVGPTASGKTALALEIAPRLDAEIVSMDSMQVYRGMDIGTAKPSSADRAAIPHHMIDIVDPQHPLSVVEFREKAREAIRGIVERGRLPLLVGGSGLYFRAVVDPLEFPGTDPEVRERLSAAAEAEGPGGMYDRLQMLDPAAAEFIQPQNTRRIVRALEVIEITGRRFSESRETWDQFLSIYDLEVVGIDIASDELRQRIDARVDQMVAHGLIEEVKALEAAGLRRWLTSPQALGYAQILSYLDGEITSDEAVEETKRRTRRFARRQVSWFRGDPRVRWFRDPSSAAQYLLGRAGH